MALKRVCDGECGVMTDAGKPAELPPGWYQLTVRRSLQPGQNVTASEVQSMNLEFCGDCGELLMDSAKHLVENLRKAAR